jgi:hypothetical protein
MTTSFWFPRLARLAPIGLAGLNECAELQTRLDRKYLLPLGELAPLLAGVGPETRVLEIENSRSFGYESVYFDTPQLTTYLLAARRRRRRFKVRTRTYLDSAQCWLEVKTRGPRGVTVKNRIPYQSGEAGFQPAGAELRAGRRYVNEILATQAISTDEMVFVPTLVTRYRRSTLYLPATGSRVTIDTELCWQRGEIRLQLPGLAIVETKTGSTASQVDRLLWAAGRRPVRISKYATGLAALCPQLPAGPWRRVLRTYFPADAGELTGPTARWLQAS